MRHSLGAGLRARWGRPVWRDSPASPFPAWQAEDLTGKSILVRYEQGLGDNIHFIRYALPSRLNILHERVHFHEVTVTPYPLFDPSPPRSWPAPKGMMDLPIAVFKRATFLSLKIFSTCPTDLRTRLAISSTIARPGESRSLSRPALGPRD